MQSFVVLLVCTSDDRSTELHIKSVLLSTFWQPIKLQKLHWILLITVLHY